MIKGLVIRNGIDIDINWKDRMVIDIVPIAIAPTSFASTLAVGGSLINGTTYFYRVTAMGQNGESAVNTVETSKIATAINKTINLSWTAQNYVSEYRIYRGTVTGVYDGYFRVFTNSFSDDGTKTMVTVGNKVPPATNPMQGEALGGGYVGNCKREYYLFAGSSINGGVYIKESDTDARKTKQRSIIHLSWNSDKLLEIDLADVLIPNTWNTPNDDSGLAIALTDIQAWSTVP